MAKRRSRLLIPSKAELEELKRFGDSSTELFVVRDVDGKVKKTLAKKRKRKSK